MFFNNILKLVLLNNKVGLDSVSKFGKLLTNLVTPTPKIKLVLI